MIIFHLSCKEHPKPPTISTKNVTEITANSAVSGGTILNDGGDVIILNGVCWNTSGDPTIDDSKTTESGGGSYVSDITMLTPVTTYYVRAYATNRGGTVYGNTISFTTMGDGPEITEKSIKNVAVNTVSIGCSINPNYLNTTVTCEWGQTTGYGNTASSNQDPVTGSDPVNLVIDITGLESEVTYNLRIKATNELGTAYSDNLTFKTYATVDGDGNGYYSVTIGTQEWLTKNLMTTKYNDGTDIPNVTTFTEWAALTTGAYCNYSNSTDSLFIETYGRLYNWYTINTGKLAPEGWHVPTKTDWTILSDFWGGKWLPVPI